MTSTNSHDLDFYIAEWEMDSKINIEAIDRESIKIPNLHAKYLTYLANERQILKKLVRKRKTLVLTLTDYYSGKIDGRDIGREPFPYNETKAGVEKRVENDPDILKLDALYDIQEEKILFLKEVITNINQRNFQLKTALDFIKFTSGV